MIKTLKATINEQEFNLWKAPAYVQNMCMATSEGVQTELKGIKAVRALRCYIEWVRQVWIKEGNFDPILKEDLELYKNEINSHISLIEESLKNTLKVKIWIA